MFAHPPVPPDQKTTEYLGKINGATGTWATHVVVPGNWPTRWLALSWRAAGLTWNPHDHADRVPHDWQAEALRGRGAPWSYRPQPGDGRVDLHFDGLLPPEPGCAGSTGSSTMPLGQPDSAENAGRTWRCRTRCWIRWRRRW